MLASEPGRADRLVGGRWRLGDLLGRGAVAEVYAATDDQTGSPAAVKLLSGNGPDDDQRFVREIAVLRSLEHPAVVRILDHGVDDEVGAFVVLERAEGGSLDHRLTSSGPLPADTVASMGAALADGLAAAHAKGIVHRDVKPSNVLLDADGSARLTDFGVAHVDGAATITASGWCIGTPAYLAPEQARGERAGPEGDVYSLGLVLLESATGERAYPGAGMPGVLARLDRAPELPASLPPRLRGALAAMTAIDPADRPTALAAAELLRISVDDGATGLVPVVDLETSMLPAAVAPAAVVEEAPAARAPDVAPVHRQAQRAWLTVAALVVAAIALAGVIRVLPDGPRAAPASADPTTTATVAPTTAATTATTAPPTTPAPAPAPPPKPHGGHGHGHHDH